LVFSSLYFIFIFLPVVCGGYFLIKWIFPQKLLLRNLFLFVASLFFYAWGEPLYVFLMLVSIICNYFFALRQNKAIFIISICFNLVFLLFFKYSGFLVSNFNFIFKTDFTVPELSLPIGISFYTFQALSYVIDVHRKKIEPQKNILTLALYICLFPQLIAGPIVRYIEIEKELNDRRESFDGFIEGLKTFMLGLACKVILANNLALVADGIFGNFEEACPSVLWIAALSYALQIYFDFYGYSKMAIGLGKIFGFSFPDNFNYPYCASSITDFWRRWHITLSIWFRDYVYIPLGGNRVGLVRHIFNILITWLFTGFWHGASWNFVLWGLYWFAFLMLERLLLKPVLGKLRILPHLYLLLVVYCGWILFRFTDVRLGWTVFRALIGANGNRLSDFLTVTALQNNLFLLLASAIACTPLVKQLSQRLERYAVWRGCCASLFPVLLLLLSTCALVGESYNPFLYFQF
jgi:alginate O-acetyltransferase complex protein AlgI